MSQNQKEKDSAMGTPGGSHDRARNWDGSVGDVSLQRFATKLDVKWIPHWTKLASAES